MNKKSEILIVGGGYAGLAAAIAAAGHGADVTLLERYDSIGKISRCGGGTWENEIDPSYGVHDFAQKINRVAFISSKNYAEHSVPDETLCVIDTRAFLKRLESIAIAKGAKILCSHDVRGLLKDGRRITGVIAEHRGSRMELAAGMTIDCSGVARGAFGKTGNRLTDKQKAFGLEVEIDKQPDSDFAKLIVGSESAPTGYAWVSPCPHGRTRVGVGFISPKYWRLGEPFLKYVFEHHMKGIDGFKIVERRGGFIPCHYPIKKILHDGLALAGDSAGHISLLTGEGTRYALKWGEMLGSFYAKSGRCGKKEQEALQRELLDEWTLFRKLLVKQYFLNRVMKGLSNKQWNNAVSLLTKANSQTFTRLVKGDISFKYALGRIIRRLSA